MLLWEDLHPQVFLHTPPKALFKEVRISNTGHLLQTSQIFIIILTQHILFIDIFSIKCLGN